MIIIKKNKSFDHVLLAFIIIRMHNEDDRDKIILIYYYEMDKLLVACRSKNVIYTITTCCGKRVLVFIEIRTAASVHR